MGEQCLVCGHDVLARLQGRFDEQPGWPILATDQFDHHINVAICEGNGIV